MLCENLVWLLHYSRREYWRWPASAARDIAMLEQIHHDSVLMVHHNSAEEATAIGFVDESELAPSVAALFKYTRFRISMHRILEWIFFCFLTMADR